MTKNEFLSYYYRNLALGIDIIRIDGASFKLLDNDIVVMTSYDNTLDYEEIKIFDFVDVIGADCFYGNTIIKKVDLSNVFKVDKNAFDSSSIREVYHNGKLRVLENGSFRFSALEKIDLSCVDILSTRVFSGCLNLDSVSLKERVRLSGRTFQATGLKSIILDTDIIQSGSFSNCLRLESVDIHAYHIMAGSFYNCPLLSNVTINRECKIEDETILNLLSR